MNKIVTALILFFCIFPVYAFSVNQEQIDKALSFYAQENYEEAIKEYEIMLLQGLNNPYIFHNLSNAYYKIGNIGKSSVNIERALRLAPRDRDIHHDRKLLAKLSKEPNPNTAELIAQEIQFLISLNEITVITSSIFILLVLSFSLYCFKNQKIFFKVSILFSILFLVSIILFYIKINNECIIRQAIVLTDTSVRNKPIKTEDVAFEVYAGRKVIILSELGKWVNIKLLLDGFSGWVDKNSVEKI